jgi:hypothetical protein
MKPIQPLRSRQGNEEANLRVLADKADESADAVEDAPDPSSRPSAAAALTSGQRTPSKIASSLMIPLLSLVSQIRHGEVEHPVSGSASREPMPAVPVTPDRRRADPLGPQNVTAATVKPASTASNSPHCSPRQCRIPRPDHPQTDHAVQPTGTPRPLLRSVAPAFRPVTDDTHA